MVPWFKLFVLHSRACRSWDVGQRGHV